MPKTKDSVLKAMIKYNKKPEVKARMRKYYEDNKEIIQARAKEIYRIKKQNKENNLLLTTSISLIG